MKDSALTNGRVRTPLSDSSRLKESRTPTSSSMRKTVPLLAMAHASVTGSSAGSAQSPAGRRSASRRGDSARTTDNHPDGDGRCDSRTARVTYRTICWKRLDRNDGTSLYAHHVIPNHTPQHIIEY